VAVVVKRLSGVVFLGLCVLLSIRYDNRNVAAAFKNADIFNDNSVELLYSLPKDAVPGT